MKATSEPPAEETGDPGRRRPVGTTVLSRYGRTFLAGVVEAALLRHPYVKECAVVQRTKDKQIWAFLIMENDAEIKTENIPQSMRRHLRKEKIWPSKHPNAFYVLRALPTKNGRVDRVALATHARIHLDMDVAREECVIPRIRRPLCYFALEGVVWDRRTAGLDYRIEAITLALLKDNARLPFKVEIRCKRDLTRGLKIGLHVIVEGEIKGGGTLFCTSWQRKTDLRTRIPLDQTDKLLESLHT